MVSLGDIAKVEHNIKNSALPAVKALHVIAFGEEGQPRRVRRNLRGFTGFGLNENSNEFNEKVDDVLSKVDYPNLITACHILNLDYTGDKDEIGRRICVFLNKPRDDGNNDEGDENEDDEEQPKDDEEKRNDDDEYEDQDDELSSRFQESLRSTRPHRQRQESSKNIQSDKSFALTFRDIEESIRSFDGKHGYPVRKWIEEFEEIAELTGWNELQKLIFAKKSLRGTAKLYIQSEKGVTSWSILKRLLKEEFEEKVSSAQIHKMLMQKKKKKEESVQEYVLAMREISNRVNIEDEALMQYIIDGIIDDHANKIVLYGAKTFSEFKEKIKLYEVIKSKGQGYVPRDKGNYNAFDRFKKEKVNNTESTKQSDNVAKKTQSAYLCFNCGIRGHKSNYCPSKQKGTKCFACNEYGHLSRTCPTKTTGAGPSTGATQERTAVNTIVRNNMMNVTIDGCRFSSLFDTGSDINIIREDIFKNNLNNIRLAQSPLLISGIGGSQIKTLGSFTSDTAIDDETFPLTFHVMPESATNFEMIIGNPLLSQAEVSMTNDRIVVHRIKNKIFMMHMRLIDDDELDTNHIRDPIIKKSVENVVNAYKPDKTETTGVEMKIVLINEEPIYESPRRLPLPEKKEVEKQVHECLEDSIIRHSYHLEVLAITEALTKFRVYLLGNKFKIITDCEAFKKTMEKNDLATRVARWALLLEEFDYEIEHRKGERMRHVDALSRYPAVMTIENVVLRKVQGAQQQDSNLKAIIKILETETYEDYLLENGILYKERNGENLLVIPKSMQTEILRTAHEPGHFGVKKTKSLINTNYFIPKIRKKIEEYIGSCVSCILGNRKQGQQEGLLNPISKGNVPLDTYHLDHCGPFESTKKSYKYILLMVDAFSKFVWIFPTKTLSTKEVLDKLTLHQVTFGNPRRIITDKGGAFRAQDFNDYCQDENIEHVEITTGVPRGNGQAENRVQIVTSALRRLCCDDPPSWYKHVARPQIAINSTCTRSTSYSPFKLMFGVDMKVKEIQDLVKILEEVGREVFEETRYELRESARLAIKKIQEENSKSYNKKRKIASSYQIGDVVVIKRTQFGTQNKLFPRFLGPYKVIKIKGRDRYDVERVGKGKAPKSPQQVQTI